MFPDNLKSILEEINYMSQDCNRTMPRAKEYHMLSWGLGAVSVEEAVCLYGLIFVTRPDEVIELGTSTGASALVLGAACRDLGKGKVTSVDYGGVSNDKCLTLTQRYLLPIEYVQSDSVVFLTQACPDPNKRYFVFSDTDIKIRPREVALVLEKFPPGTVIAVHDSRDGHPGGSMKLPEKFPDENIIQLPSPRGLSILMKPEEDA